MMQLYDSIDIRSGKLTVSFTSDFIKTEIVLDDFWAVYEGVDLSTLDESILNIPVLLNVAPAIWAMGVDVKVPVIDKGLADSFEKLKSTLKGMYPKLKWDGTISAEKIADSHIDKKGRPALFFSGGLDSVFSTMRHLDEKPLLITVRGSDVSLSDDNGWELVKNQSLQFAKKYKLEIRYIESNFLDFLNQPMLSSLDDSIPGWWAGVQHGMGFSGLMSPISAHYKINNLYIASSHSKAFNSPWGSCPDIDNNISYGVLNVFHDGYEYTRHGKLKELLRICEDMHLEKPTLRVCYSNAQNSGENCCICEKCSRTITALFVEGEDPNKYGFDINPELFVDNAIKHI